MSEILLTGATGFIGSFMLRRLLEQGRRPYVLVRATDPQAARDTIRRGLGGNPALLRQIEDRILIGDITQVDCGLDTAGKDALKRDCDTLIHAAAQTNFHDISPGELRRTNGRGARNAALLADRLGFDRMIHFSTLYVCGTPPRIFGEPDVDIGQSPRNAYEVSKLEGERLVREVMRDSVTRLTVLRPGIVTASTLETDGCLPDNLRHFLGFYRRAALRWRADRSQFAIPLNHNDPLLMTPVNYVANFALALLHDAQAWDTTYHIQTPQSTTWGEIHSWMKEYSGAWGVRMTGRSGRATRRLGAPFGEYGDYLWNPPYIDDRQGRTFAIRHGLDCPRLNKEMLGRFWDQYMGDVGQSGIHRQPAVAIPLNTAPTEWLLAYEN